MIREEKGVLKYLTMGLVSPRLFQASSKERECFFIKKAITTDALLDTPAALQRGEEERKEEKETTRVIKERREQEEERGKKNQKK